jgi:hypothetical protein
MSIWDNTVEPSYDLAKQDVAFSQWRVAVMDCLTSLSGKDQTDSVQKMHQYGLAQLGLDYEDNVTAQELASKLNK